MRVLLVNMPWISLGRPAIGVSLLKASLQAEGHECRVAYGNLLLAGRVGREDYELVCEGLSAAFFAGDWLFAQHLFGPQLDLDTYVATLHHYLDGDQRLARVLRLRAEVGPFLEACLERFGVAGYDLVGFSTTFEQNLASLALARLIKQRHPDKTVVFGGANCEGVMGRELHRSFPWIDYVVSGEADQAFPELVRCLARGQRAPIVPGVVGRGGAAPPALPIADLDALPVPDYDDYFEALGQLPFAAELRPALLIESARGCWWGARSHCTFCGLNGATMAFRSKSAPRVLAELEGQQRRYGVNRFLAVDNILPYDYFKTLLPALKERRLGVSLFYEVKSNLKREQVALLRDAGVLALQPGVESLSTPVLKLMRKGVSGLQNVQLLKLCREYGIEIAWNLLYGFPGERPEHYDEMAATLEAVYHLKPPGTAAVIRLDRFSPNFDHAAEFGLADVRPFALYQHLYPLPPERVANLAYFFEYRHADGQRPESYLSGTLERLAVWKANAGGDLLMHANGEPHLALVDTRPGREPRRYHLAGLERELYELCGEVRGRGALLAHLHERLGRQADVEAGLDAFLEQMVREKLMLREGDQFLSLAVPAGTPPVIDAPAAP